MKFLRGRPSVYKLVAFLSLCFHFFKLLLLCFSPIVSLFYISVLVISEQPRIVQKTEEYKYYHKYIKQSSMLGGPNSRLRFMFCNSQLLAHSFRRWSGICRIFIFTTDKDWIIYLFDWAYKPLSGLAYKPSNCDGEEVLGKRTSSSA